jgi:hypothetical protein
MIIDKILFSIISDLLINLSAGWFGAILIVPNFSKIRGRSRLWVLLSDFVAAMICLAISYELRRFI